MKYQFLVPLLTVKANIHLSDMEDQVKQHFHPIPSCASPIQILFVCLHIAPCNMVSLLAYLSSLPLLASSLFSLLLPIYLPLISELLNYCHFISMKAKTLDYGFRATISSPLSPPAYHLFQCLHYLSTCLWSLPKPALIYLPISLYLVSQPNSPQSRIALFLEPEPLSPELEAPYSKAWGPFPISTRYHFRHSQKSFRTYLSNPLFLYMSTEIIFLDFSVILLCQHSMRSSSMPSLLHVKNDWIELLLICPVY